jgi:hypothetical protein
MKGLVRFRSNVVLIRDEEDRKRAWRSIPGEIAGDYRSLHLLTPEQQQERSLYGPCPTCSRSLSRVKRQGCQYPNCPSAARARALLGPLETLALARERLDAERAEGPNEPVDVGRGRIEPIPLWNPTPTPA